MKERTSKRLLMTGVLLLPAMLHFFPIVYMVSLSLKGAAEAFDYPPSLIPKAFDLGNYSKAVEAAPLARFLVNSFFVSAVVTLIQLFTCTLAAFALSRIEFWGRSAFFAIILATMMIPGEITIIPNFLLMAKLEWLDTYAALILPFSASGFGVFLLYQFFKAIPKELEEAVIVDGGSRWRFLWQFVVPLSKPALISFGVYAFVSTWNQYLWPLITTHSTEMRTVQIGVSMFRSENEASSWGIIMAATTLLVMPSILIFVATQRQFVRGMTMSGIKG